jgi:hypothetical protein
MMKTHDNTTTVTKFLTGLSAGLCVCLGLQALCLFGLDGGTGKTESNYFSTLSRFQAAARPPAEIALAGSSITGRLPGREAGNERIANLGSDGGPALDGIRMLVEGNIALPRWLVIEMNTIYGGVGFGDSLISRSARGPWFVVGTRVPLLGASARPTGMLYAQLLRRPKVLEGKAFSVQSKVFPVTDTSSVYEMSEAEKIRMQEYAADIKLLRQRGVKILLVNYPAGHMSDHERTLMQVSMEHFSQNFQVEYLDLANQIPPQSLHFTDGVHLDPTSAARILATIESYCRRLDN